jgi:uncharacterized protein (DUF433 family)
MGKFRDSAHANRVWPAPATFRAACGTRRSSFKTGVAQAPSDAITEACQKATMKGEDNSVATVDWSDCPLVEVIPGKVSGVPLLKNTRLPVHAIIGNYDAFRDEGLSPDDAIAETLDCYPEAGLDTIKAILAYRAAHQLQAQL